MPWRPSGLRYFTDQDLAGDDLLDGAAGRSQRSDLPHPVDPHKVMVIGTLDRGGLFSAQLEGAQAHRTGLQIDITGTDGVLRFTNARAFENKDDNALLGMTGGATEFAPLPVPEEYGVTRNPDLDVSAQDTAHLYAAYARDRITGTHDASDFHDAVAIHRLIDRITASSHRFFR